MNCRSVAYAIELSLDELVFLTSTRPTHRVTHQLVLYQMDASPRVVDLEDNSARWQSSKDSGMRGGDDNGCDICLGHTGSY